MSSSAKPAMHCAFALIVLLSLTARGHGGAAGGVALRETILALDEQFWHAGSKHDVQTLERLIADDYVGLGHDGQRWTKPAVLRQYAAVRTADLSVKGEREVVRVNDDAAILMYTAGFSVVSKEGAVVDRARQRLLSCWTRRDGRWVVVFAQVADAREAEGAAPAPGAAAAGAVEGKGDRQAVVAQALAAHGGREQLEAIRQIVMTTRRTDRDGGVTTTRVWVRVPGGYRCEIERANEPTMICILGDNGMRRWTRDVDGRPHELHLSGTEPTMEYWEDVIEHFGPRHALRLVEPGSELTVLPAEKDAGGARVPVRIVPKRGGERTFFLDAASHLLLKERRGDLELLYQDYKAHDDVPVARRIEESAKSHQRSARTEITDVAFPETLEERIFRQP